MLPIKYQTWDNIVLDLEKSDKIMAWWKEQDIETVENIPFNKGVITCKNAIISGQETYDIHTAFELKSESIIIEEIYGINGATMNRWELLYGGSLINGVPNFNIAYEPQFQKAKQRMLDLTILFMGIVNFIMHYKEEVAVVGRKPNLIDIQKRKKKKKSGTVYIPSKIYSIHTVPEGKTPKKLERHTDSWGVRGHERHYKSGKVVWIKPYVKGDKDKVQPKEYKVTTIENKKM